MARILPAAERVFAEAGFEGASMSAIAAEAGLPKPNLHYYVGTKEALYRALLRDILDTWLAGTDAIVAGAEPAAALESYVRLKMRLSRERPHASRVFANEVLHGAPFLRTTLGRDLRALVDRKAAVIEGWIAEGRMAPVDPRHLFFAIWAMTQTYADFAPQIQAVLGARRMGRRVFEDGTASVLALVLGGCGLGAPSRDDPGAPSRDDPGAPSRNGA